MIEVWKSQDQILGKENYVAIEKQSLYDGHILALCSAAGLSTWDRIVEVGKKTKVIQGPKVTFMNFLKRLTSTGNRMIPNA